MYRQLIFTLNILYFSNINTYKTFIFSEHDLKHIGTSWFEDINGVFKQSAVVSFNFSSPEFICSDNK